MSKKVILSEQREVPLLLFLWKWKVVSTAALIAKFFPNCTSKTAYNRLLALRQAGLIRIRSDGFGKKCVYTLTDTGFKGVREYLQPLNQEGYKSESIGHDLLVTAFHLGNWLKDKPSEVSFFSEQQLRRLEVEYYPDWVPKSPGHRADGYTQLGLGEDAQTFAIEVEIHQKRDVDYLQLIEFYQHYPTVNKVLWLVSRKGLAETVNQKIKANLRGKKSPHQFILFEEFQKHGWQSQIYLGSDQRNLLSNLYLEKLPISARNLPDLNLVHSLLDTRKSPHNSMTYSAYQIGDFSD